MGLDLGVLLLQVKHVLPEASMDFLVLEVLDGLDAHPVWIVRGHPRHD